MKKLTTIVLITCLCTLAFCTEIYRKDKQFYSQYTWVTSDNKIYRKDKRFYNDYTWVISDNEIYRKDKRFYSEYTYSFSENLSEEELLLFFVAQIAFDY